MQREEEERENGSVSEIFCRRMGLHQSPLIVHFVLLGFGLLDLADGFV